MMSHDNSDDYKPLFFKYEHGSVLLISAGQMEYNEICHLLQVLRLYESTTVLPAVICLTGQRSSSDGGHDTLIENG